MASAPVIVLDEVTEQHGPRPESCVFENETGERVEVACDSNENGTQCLVPKSVPCCTVPIVKLQDGSSVEAVESQRDLESQSQAGIGAIHDCVVHFRYATPVCNGPESPQSRVDERKVTNWQEDTLAWLRGDRNTSEHSNGGPTLVHKLMAEALGTAMIVIFGCGSVCAAVLTGAQTGLWQVAVVWGFGVALAIYTTASVSGAHLNPAISLAFATLRPASFPWSDLLPYCFAQLLGAVLGGIINLIIFDNALRAFESTHGFHRGDPASVMTAACFGEYFPNPGFQYSSPTSSELSINPDLGWASLMTPFSACCVEAWGTAILALVIFALTDSRNSAMVRKEMVPFFIGFAVAALISIYAPLTQAGWNPARDFGPRIVAYFAGWGTVAIPGPQNGFWVYIVGPLFGAVLGASLYEFVVARALKSPKDAG